MLVSTMRVRRSSWHYRTYRWLYFDDLKPDKYREPKNLCLYFWSLAIPGLFLSAAGLGIVGLVAWGLIWAFVLHTLTALAVVGGLMLLIFIFYWLYRLGQWLDKRPAPPPKPEVPPGPVRAYLRAKKSRVCPYIQVEDR